MTGTLKAGFLPIDLFFENSILPDLSLVQGDAGLRGYAARFFSADGVLMEKGAAQSARLYAANPDDKKSAYYLEGTYTDGVWLLEVPTEAISKAGRVLLQVALYEGETALIQSRASLVEVPLSIAQGGASGHSVRVDFDRVDALLKEARTAMDEADRRSKVAEDYANRGNADLARLEGGEEERRKAEADRKADFEALKEEGARTVTSLNQTNAQYQAITASAEAEEAARKQAELERARAEAERDTNENKRQTQEQDRTNAEGKREASEGARKTQEDARSQSEAQRKNAEAERERKETERKSAEAERKGAEAEREASEGIRKAQEGERVEAEKSRKATFESWNKTMDGVIPLAEEAAPGIVKVKKATGEEKPYTVPTVGVLTEKADKTHTHKPSDIEGLSQALEAAGRVKSVNGKTGDVVLSPATQSADGLFSMSDKAKLDGIEAGANRYIHPATHKIQEIDGLGRVLGQKSDTGHTHSDYLTKSEAGSTYQTKSAMTSYATKSDLAGKFILCTSEDDARTKADSGSYPSGTVFLIPKE